MTHRKCFYLLTEKQARTYSLLALVILGFWLAGGSCLAADAKTTIESLSAVDGTGALKSGEVAVGLNGWLGVILKGDTSKIDPTKTVLFLNGSPIPGLTDTQYLSSKSALVFHLVRNIDNAAAWKPLLGSPDSLSRPVAVALWLKKPAPDADQTPIAGENGVQPNFQLVLISGWWLVFGFIALFAVIGSIWLAGSKTSLLKDSLLPQLTPTKQTFSLGRWQMAFWFTLVFSAFVFLFVLLWDYNTVTSQALVLMGLSSATAIFAVQIDASKDTPIGAANETLQSLGLRTYGDVLQLETEIKERQDKLNNTPPPTDENMILQLKTEIADRLNKQRTYRDITRPFLSQGWYSDLTTDVNGPALHRLQVFVWTLMLGVVFVIGIYRDLSMPQFSNTLLALMGVTSAGYLGFKYPERQS
jgi:hypothetical protein